MSYVKFHRDVLAKTFSALYGKLLVVMGIAFPTAEVISTYKSPPFYEGFYLYLYLGSMIFLAYAYATLLRDNKSKSKRRKDVRDAEFTRSLNDACGDRGFVDACSHVTAIRSVKFYGSSYLRVGAVAFGVGSMVYSGLEFGQYLEVDRNSQCQNVVLALTLATRIVFVFVQMHFIFYHNEQMRIHHNAWVIRLGLMHMIGANLCIWLNVIVQETKHEILALHDPENSTLEMSYIHECRRRNIMGSLVQDASPFLFPFTIQYNMICATILYVMWRNLSRHVHTYRESSDRNRVNYERTDYGLFVGIPILALTIISLILFFVLISRSDLTGLAVTEVNGFELTLYGMSTMATLVGMYQMRELCYNSNKNFQLDNILLIAAQTGTFVYSTFTIIGGQFTLVKHAILVVVTALASMAQTTLQTIFILDASRRSVVGAKRYPGRETVTFLLVMNVAMWTISTVEKSRAKLHQVQLHFYGLWAWIIITHVSMPLAIFYRFHSTVCLYEIWKRAYKAKPTYT